MISNDGLKRNAVAHIANNVAHVVDKAVRQHFVSLIQHQHTHTIQSHPASAQTIDQTTRRAHDDLRRAQQLPIGLKRCTASNTRHIHAHACRQLSIHACCLSCQLAHRLQHQDLWLAQRRVDARQRANGKRTGLASTTLCLNNTISSL